MTDSLLPPAASMRQRLDSAASEEAQAQLNQLAASIEATTERGQSSLRVDEFATGVQEALKRAGYKVHSYSPDQRDSMSGEQRYFTVSW